MRIVPFTEPNEHLKYAYFFEVNRCFGISYVYHAAHIHKILLGIAPRGEDFLNFRWLMFTDINNMGVFDFKRWYDALSGKDRTGFLEKAFLP